MDIVFFGSGAFGVPTLQSLARNHTVRAVVSQPDRPAGRGKKLTPTPISQLVIDQLLPANPNLTHLRPDRVNEPDTLAAIRAIQADAWVVIAFGQKLSEPLLADRFAINLHASRLPKWRGAAPIHHAILAGDEVTGNSVITLAQRMDAGEILGQSRRPIEPTHTTGELHDLLAHDGPQLVEQVLSDFQSGNLKRMTQDEAAVTLAGKLSREDARIDPNTMDGEACRRLINGLSPWPGVQASIAGAKVKLLRAAPASPPRSAAPGTLLDTAQGVFAGRQGAFQILELQPIGKRAMTWEQFTQGRDLAEGALLEGDG